MLSYRHAFHAGNHGDVLKHLVLLECLDHLANKDKPYLYVDTHAGAGAYALDSGYAAMNCEWAAGIARLGTYGAGSHASGSAPGTAPGGLGGPVNPEHENPIPLPSLIVRYLRSIAEFGVSDPGSWYPGSPALAAQCMRHGDRAVLCELHSSDHALLHERFAADRRFKVLKTDGFAQLKALLPPPTRRGIVLIDPSYELAQDYSSIPTTLKDALARFATGIYLIWYPLLERQEARDLPAAVESLADSLGRYRFLRAELRIRSSIPGERGMAGSGMLVLNPPWQLAKALEEVLPVLTAALGQDRGAGWILTAGK
ncbi:MAG: 23S rRNA (adenine(2030)-N(6))-methyltransferase RlmJ [Clostridia bacterium]